MVAIIQYNGTNIASLTARILPFKNGQNPRILFLHVPACKNGDGTFNVQEISLPSLDDYTPYPIQFKGDNWDIFE
jgi:hypothetical protein